MNTGTTTAAGNSRFATDGPGSGAHQDPHEPRVRPYQKQADGKQRTRNAGIQRYRDLHPRVHGIHVEKIAHQDQETRQTEGHGNEWPISALRRPGDAMKRNTAPKPTKMTAVTGAILQGSYAGRIGRKEANRLVRPIIPTAAPNPRHRRAPPRTLSRAASRAVAQHIRPSAVGIRMETQSARRLFRMWMSKIHPASAKPLIPQTRATMQEIGQPKGLVGQHILIILSIFVRAIAAPGKAAPTFRGHGGPSSEPHGR